MGQLPEPADLGNEAAQLLTLARQLREAATRVGRPDVAAKADEAIALLAGADEPKAEADGKGNTVLRILDGLGF